MGQAASQEDDVTRRNVVLTGATAGIGKEIARQLYFKGANIYIGARDEAKALAVIEEIKQDFAKRFIKASGVEAVGSLHFLPLDMASLDSTRKFAELFLDKNVDLHLLICNGAILANSYELTKDGFERTFQVNYLANYVLTMLLLDRMKETAKKTPCRIVNVSSVMHTMGIFDSAGNFQRAEPWSSMGAGALAYGDSKLLLNMFTVELAEQLKKQNIPITVNCVHPGGVATDIYREMNLVVRGLTSLFLTSPAKGAIGPLHLALSSDLANVTGKYFDGKVEKPMLNPLVTAENCAILREKTEEILNNRIAFVDDHEEPPAVSAPPLQEPQPLHLGDEVHEELPGVEYLPDHKAVLRGHWGSEEGNEGYLPELNMD